MSKKNSETRRRKRERERRNKNIFNKWKKEWRKEIGNVIMSQYAEMSLKKEGEHES